MRPLPPVQPAKLHDVKAHFGETVPPPLAWVKLRLVRPGRSGSARPGLASPSDRAIAETPQAIDLPIPFLLIDIATPPIQLHGISELTLIKKLSQYNRRYRNRPE